MEPTSMTFASCLFITVSLVAGLIKLAAVYVKQQSAADVTSTHIHTTFTDFDYHY